MKVLKILNPENVSDKEIKDYPTRNAARAVVFDKDGQVGLLHVSLGDYYKIPGGGLEGDEDPRLALERECLEEIGCEVEVLGEIGRIVEHRKMFKLNQISDCYLARVKGEKGEPQFTDDEVNEGFKVVWLPYNEAVEAISKSKATVFEASGYMVPRDTIFLEEAQKHLKVI